MLEPDAPLWRYLEHVDTGRRADAHRVYLYLRRKGWTHADAATIAAYGKGLTYESALLGYRWLELMRTIVRAIRRG